jgi:hypothetical protein
MLRLLRLMTCLICSWSLLLYHTQAYAACDSSDPETASLKKSCDESKGQYWDNNTCRCQNSEGAQHLRDASATCRDEKDPEIQRTCMENLAKSASQTESLSGILLGDSTANSAIQGIAKAITTMSLVMVVVSMLGSSPYSGSCYSRYVFMVVSLGAIGFEIYSYFALEGKLRDLRKRYKQEVLCQNEDGTPLTTSSSGSGSGGGIGCMESSRPGPFEAQKRAFQFLLDEQKGISDTAFTKWIAYAVIAIAYAAVIIVAAVEWITGNCAVTTKIELPDQNTKISNHDACQLNPENDQFGLTSMDFEFFTRPQTPTSLVANQLKEFFSTVVLSDVIAADSGSKSQDDRLKGDINIDSLKTKSDKKFIYDGETPAETQGPLLNFLIGGGTGAVLGIVAAILNTTVPAIKKILLAPLGFIILSGLGMIFYSILSDASRQQHEIAKSNAAKVEEVMAMWEQQASAHCPNGRESLAEPKCYCFQEGGGRNPNREKSATCQALFASLDTQLDLSGDDDKFGADSDILGCMTSDGKFDRDCRCKLFTDKKTGQNACATAPMASSNLGGIGVGSGSNDALRNLNSLTNGSLGKALNAGSIIGSAKKIKKGLDQALLKAKQKTGAGKFPQPLSLAQAQAFAAKIVPEKAIAAAMANGMGGGSEGGGLTDPGMKSALDQVKEAKKLQMTDGKGKAKEAKKDGPDFNFDLGGAPGADKGDEIGGFMDKKYNYKDNDIVNNEGASIFQVITNRYNQSGYTRLFEEKEAAPPQK